MKNSITAAPRPAARKTTKKRQRNKKQIQLIITMSIVLVFLIVFSINASKGEVYNNDLFESGNSATTYTDVSDEIKTENITEKIDETTKLETTEQPTEPQIKPSKENQNYTKDDLYYLAAAICNEAGGESEEIQLLVANVIINRVNSSIYPNTIYDVLTDYKQYGMMWKYGVSFPNWADQKVINQCYSVARRILDGERFCPENVLFQAEFKQGSGIFKQFGDDYYFCYYG